MTNPRQNFNHVDVLRLEVAPEQTGLVNLIENPSGALGAVGWITPQTNTFITGGTELRFTQNTGFNSMFKSEPLPVVAGRHAGFSFKLLGGTASETVRVMFEWYGSGGSLLSTSTASPVWATNAATVSFGPIQVPTSATTAQVRIEFSTGVAGSYFTFREATFATSATSSDIGITRTNYATNPSLESNLTGWTGTQATLARSTAGVWTGGWGLSITCADNVQALARMTGPGGAAVFAGRTYTISAYVLAGSTSRQMQIAAKGTGFSSFGPLVTVTSGAWVRLVHTFTLTGSAGFNVDISVLGQTGLVFYADAVLVEEASSAGTYFDASTPDTGTIQYDASGPFSVAQTTYLGYVQPLQYVNIIGPTHDIKVKRAALDLGTLNATILDVTLDPATANTIRPGRKCRLMVKVDPTKWEPMFTGKVTAAEVTYDLKANDPTKVARITLSAVDATAQLANATRPDGVGTINDLPYVLEGTGVPWNVNGSGNQVPVVSIVSSNDNASALDQIALTRDTRSGYAWVDRFSTVNVRDSANMPTTTTVTLDESVYSDLNVSFSTEDCINEVVIKNIEWDAADPTKSIEVTYGPYFDQASIDEWGPYSSTFTTHGLDATELNTLAVNILARNKTPGVRINSVRVPVLTTAHVAERAILDLYDLARMKNDAKSLDHNAHITDIEHTITDDGWLIDIRGTRPTSVASPQVTPPIQSSPSSYAPGVWYPFAINVPNVPQTTNYAKFMRIGNTVTVHANITLTGGISSALIDMPFAFASDTVFHESNKIGTVKALRSGVAWHPGNIAPITSTPARAAIYVDDGGGAQFNATTPAAWVAGDRWGLDFTYEAAPL